MESNSPKRSLSSVQVVKSIENYSKMIRQDDVNCFDYLPDSVILTIFHKLNLRSLLNCSGVCIRFYKIAQDKTLKRNIELDGEDVEVGLLRKVISFANRDLLNLKVKAFRDDNKNDDRTVLTSKLFKRLYNKCPKLWYLELENVYSFSMRIQKLPRNLKHLAFRHCFFSFFSLFVKNRRNNYMSRLDKINCLDLSFSTLFDSQNCIILNNFQHLRYLYLENLYRINNGGLFWLDYPILSKLVVLDIEGTETTSEIFMYIVKNCGSLREFYLGNTYIDSQLTQLKKDKVISKKITHLCIYNLDLDIDCLNFINEILPNLQKIEMNQQLFTQIESDDGLSYELASIIIRKDIQDSYTCHHYRDHVCDKYPI